VSRWNPFFYMIDGFRYGFFGQSDVPPGLSLAVCAAFFTAVSVLSIAMLRSGYKVRH
jgi:ABC-2 type transport system permease protein